MQWEELTESDFRQAARDTGLCIVPIGSLEYHGQHLPLGTDAMNCHAIACLAAQREPAVVFPPYFYGQVNCARHYAGAVAVRPALHSELLAAVCDEIGRNGFRKILLHNGHGGNGHWLRYFVQCALYERKPYNLYLTDWLARPEVKKQVREICPPGGHADEEETSICLALRPDLVKMERAEAGPPLGRIKGLGAYAATWWYADYPNHVAGDGRPATAETGKKLLEIYVGALADVIQRVKADQIVPGMEDEFFNREKGIRP